MFVSFAGSVHQQILRESSRDSVIGCIKVHGDGVIQSKPAVAANLRRTWGDEIREAAPGASPQISFVTVLISLGQM